MKNVLYLMLLVMFSGCATTEGVKSFKGGADTSNLQDMERRVWHEANGYDATIERSGQIYADPRATAYVQGVTDRLCPEFKGKITVRILDSTELNAFAMPNGSVYINVGMLARIENEAQLATVLAHETTHFIERHSFRERVSTKNAAAFAVSGVPFSSLVAVSSIGGFSRDLEREADAKGYERLIKSGYDPREAPLVFQHLADEVKVLKVEEPYFFASHPKLTDRINEFKRLSAAYTGGGRVETETYGSIMTPIRLDALRKDIGQDRFASVILVMEDSKNSRNYPAAAHYYLGEAYSRRDEKDDASKALNAYKTAEKLAPKFAPTYMRLGMLAMKAGDKVTARRYFEQYLKLAPKDAADRAYAQQYLVSL